MKTKDQCPKLARLAEACWNGACNVSGVVRSLGDAIQELQPGEMKDHVALKIIVGQIGYLLNETAGPTETAIREYKAWANLYEDFPNPIDSRSGVGGSERFE